jgi:hypothetical protein
MTPVTLQTRELAARENDGIHFLLLWHPRQDAVTVSVDDTPGRPPLRPCRRPRPRARGLLSPIRLRRLAGRTRHITHAHTHSGKGPRCHPLKYSNNLAARIGRWSASHRKTAIFGWLAFVIAR